MRDEPVPQRFVDELSDAFERLRPQGTLPWGSGSNLTRLRRTLDRGIELAPAAGDEVDVPFSASGTTARDPARLHDAVGIGTDRWARWFGTRQIRTVARQVVERATQSSLSTIGDALEAVAGTLQYLTARVEALEGALHRAHGPVEGLASLVAPPDLGPWEGTVSAWLADAAPDAADAPDADHPGAVVVGECGDGALALTLAAAGWQVTGAEPRGPVALGAARAGVDVRVAEVGEVLQSCAPQSLAGVVLAGVVDRAALDEVVALLALAAGRLRAGGVLVVVTGDTSRWDEPAMDLLPGRPRHPATWELLLHRLELHDVVSALAPPGTGGGSAVSGRR